MADHLLLVRAPGGPSASFLHESLHDFSPVVTVYARLPGDERRWSSERPILERLGPVFQANGLESIPAEACAVADRMPVAGIVTYSELSILPTATAAALLELPHHGLEAVRVVQDKRLQRQALREAGLPGPGFATVDPKQPGRALDGLTLPAVLKPARGAGSSATIRIDKSDAFAPTYREAVALHRETLLWPGASPPFVLEEYLLDGESHTDAELAQYVSVETCIRHGEVGHLGISDRLTLAPDFRERGALVPSVLRPGEQAEVFQVATHAIAALELQHGLVHSEIKLTPDGPRIIEVNARVGGPIADLYKIAADIDLVRVGAAIALDRPITIPTPDFRRHALFMTPQSPAQDVVLVSLDGIRDVAGLPGVLAVDPQGTPPCLMRWRVAGPGGGTLVHLLAAADSRQALYSVAESTESLLRPRFRVLAAAEASARQIPLSTASSS